MPVLIKPIEGSNCPECGKVCKTLAGLSKHLNASANCRHAAKKQSRFDKLKAERRAVRVVVDLDVFASLIRDGIGDHIVSAGLPSDALFVSAGYSVEQMGCQFFYLHESFEPVPEGVQVPQVEVQLTRFANATVN